MSVIIPNSRIRLMFNVPLSSNYENTYYFEDEEEQFLFFENHFQSIEYDEQYYTRKRRGWLRINDTYNRVYNANYLFFRNVSRQVDNVANPPYENKSYYAFIDDVVYINDHTCEVHYTIDVIQTYMFTWELHQCIVERESTRSDRLYEHRIDEGLPVGDYTFTDGNRMYFRDALLTQQERYLGENPKVVIAATVNDNYEDTTEGAQITHQWHNTVVGCNLLVKKLGGAAQSDYALYWLNNLPGEKYSAILGIYLVGECVANLIDGTVPDSDFLHAEIPLPSETIGSYTPRNKKLLTAPYKSLVIFSSDGTSKVFDYSKFTGVSSISPSFTFILYLSLTAPLIGYLSPFAYNGEGQGTVSAIPMPTVPSCTWSNDTYKAWAALNSGYMASSIAGSVVDAGIRIGGAIYGAGLSGATSEAAFGSILSNETALSVGGSIGNDPSVSGWISETSGQAAARNARNVANGLGRQQSGLIGDIQNITNCLIAIHNAKIAPDAFNGSAQNLAALNANHYGYYYFSRTIREDYARVLDDYFTMFGYKVLVTKTPVLYNRSRFTYVKTLNFDIGGKIPSIYKRIICDVFNSGIRFWVDKEHIGDYSAINQPLIL